MKRGGKVERNLDIGLIDSYLQENKNSMVEFLQDSIKIKSLTYEEKEAIEFLAEKMKEYGYDEVRINKVSNIAYLSEEIYCSRIKEEKNKKEEFKERI